MTTHPTHRLRLTMAAVALATAATTLAIPAAAGTLNFPTGVAVDAAGDVYVANAFANSVTIYNRSFKLLHTITAGINGPVAVAVRQDGVIFVANNSGNNVTVYNPDLSQATGATITDPSLIAPSALALDGAGDLWVLDYTGTAHGYLDSGKPLTTLALSGATTLLVWGGNLTLWNGTINGAGPDELSVNVGELITGNVRLTTTFNCPAGSGGAATDARFQQYVAYPSRNRVFVYNTASTSAIGEIATAAAPADVALDVQGNRIYVTEPNASAVEVFSLRPPYALVGTIR